ncbi:hypothetical protein NS263_02725 [Curtobacterium oceanosedimentum]|uniref:Uncharacterized protein n=1 Tax=Curtobacterium oceanosedimentum TaxID=465820 RepID=A0ABR5S9F0_9MICO|nr:DUF6188 family protein [Curtobacterium oceanosedimentum]KTR42110.1 hypothetical protein NS263_02725 [Curtobacterium oceanosedimentum]
MSELAIEDVPLLLVGGTVDAIWVDYSLRVLLSNGATIILECPFSLGVSPDTATMIDPEGDKAGLVPALRLHTLVVTEAHAAGSTLTMTFSDGSRLTAGPHPEFESWHYNGPETPPTRIIIMPGGGLPSGSTVQRPNATSCPSEHGRRTNTCSPPSTTSSHR